MNLVYGRVGLPKTCDHMIHLFLLETCWKNPSKVLKLNWFVSQILMYPSIITFQRITHKGLRKSSPTPFWEDYAFVRNENWFKKSFCNLHLLRITWHLLSQKKNSRREFFLAADGQTLANSLGWWKTVVSFGKYLQFSTGDSKVSPIKNSSEKMSYTRSKKSTIMSYSPKTKSIFRFQPCKNLGMYNVSRRRRWNLKNESSIFCQNLIRWRGFEATTLCLIEVPFVQGWSVVCCTLDRAV